MTEGEPMNHEKHFEIVFQKLAEATDATDFEETVEEAESIAALRQVIEEIERPRQGSYTTT